MSAFITIDPTLPGGIAVSGRSSVWVDAWCRGQFSLSAEEIVRILAGRFTHVRAVLRVTHPMPGMLLYRIKYSDGNQSLAVIVRRIVSGSSVHHTLMSINRRVRRQGLSRRIQQNSVLLYASVGIHTITLEAALQDGGLYWALHGFRLLDAAAWNQLVPQVRVNYVAIRPQLSGHERAVIDKVLGARINFLMLPHFLTALPIHGRP